MDRLLAETPRDQEEIDRLVDQKLMTGSSPYSILRNLGRRSS